MGCLSKRSAGWRLLLALSVIPLLSAIPAPAQAQNFVEGQHYWLEPAVFPGIAPKGHPYGPEKAKGLVLWNDGYSGNQAAPEKVPPIIQHFAEAGWDAYNLKRHPLLNDSRGTGSAGYSDQTPALIMVALEKLKAMGYRRIVPVGQSRGAFAAVQVASYHAEVHGILPLSPAGFGSYIAGAQYVQNDLMLRGLWDKIKGAPILVGAGFFDKDDWFETKSPNVRGPYAEKRLSELGIPNFIVSEPKYTGMSGHGGGASWQFARRYGPCLEAFFDTGKRLPCEDEAADTAASFGIKPVTPTSQDGYAGKWQGTFWNGRFIVLTVLPPEDGIYKAFYQLGRGVNGDKIETSQMAFREKDNRLVRDDPVEFRLEQIDPDRIALQRIDRNKRSEAGEQPAIMVRVR